MTSVRQSLPLDLGREKEERPVNLHGLGQTGGRGEERLFSGPASLIPLSFATLLIALCAPYLSLNAMLQFFAALLIAAAVILTGLAIWVRRPLHKLLGLSEDLEGAHHCDRLQRCLSCGRPVHPGVCARARRRQA